MRSPTVLPTAGIPRKQLPRLEFLHSFEAAARHLSFTLAAKELFLTQSAISRQIAQLEMDLGVPLFTRHHRALALTESGLIMQRVVTDCLDRLRDATVRVRGVSALRQVSITCTPGFASLWLIPRLSRFTSTHPQVDVRLSATLDVLDLARSGIDIAVRFCPKREDVGSHAQPLFEETVLPLCAPALCNQVDHPLRTPADLVAHTLLTVDMPQGMAPTVEWEPWLKIMGLADVRLKNTLRFTQYTDAVAAAVAGQGVVIGRVPLLNALLQEGKLVSPFGAQAAASQRAYYIDMAAHAQGNTDAHDFVQWLRSEAVT